MKTKKKRPSPFDKNYAPYGTYEGPAKGNPNEWKSSFREAWNKTTAEDIVGQDSPWSILGLKVGSTMDEIKKAFRRLLKENHPDYAPQDKKLEATEKTKRIIAAYAVLGGQH